MTALAGWENFYVIVGSAAGALIGLEFVVVTLIADSPTLPYLSRSVNKGRLSGKRDHNESIGSKGAS